SFQYGLGQITRQKMLLQTGADQHDFGSISRAKQRGAAIKESHGVVVCFLQTSQLVKQSCSEVRYLLHVESMDLAFGRKVHRVLITDFVDFNIVAAVGCYGVQRWVGFVLKMHKNSPIMKLMIAQSAGVAQGCRVLFPSLMYLLVPLCIRVIYECAI